MVEDLGGAVEDGNQTSDREEDVVEHVHEQLRHAEPVHAWREEIVINLLSKSRVK